MIIVILNYVVRVMTVFMGIILIINPFAKQQDDPNFVRILGGIVLIFGAVRLYLYYRFQQRTKSINTENDTEDE